MKKCLTIGCFDILHYGHAELFEQMKKHGRQVIFVHDDLSIFENKKHFPLQTLTTRIINIRRIAEDAEIYTVSSSDPSEELRNYIIDHRDDELTYMRGDDWKDFPGKEIINIFNIPIEYKKYTGGISSSKIKQNI